MKRPGFTFLELLIALTLFLVGMVSIVQIFPANRRLLSQNDHMTQATFLAQETVEQLLAVNYDSLTTGTYIARSAVPNSAGTELAAFERQVVVEYLDTDRNVTNTDLGLKQITVTMYWQEYKREQTIQIVTYVAE